MASKQEYLNMMKRMEMMQGKGASTDAEMKMIDAMGEERIPAPMNMGLDSMMNKPSGSVSDKEMVPFMTDPNLKRLNVPKMTPNDLIRILGETAGLPSDFTMKEIEALKGSLSDRELDMLEGQRSDDALKNAMGAGMGALSDKELKMLEDAMGGSVSDEIRDAISGLMGMGVSLTDALEALNNDISNSIDTRPETMPEGALGSLPTRTGGSMSDKEDNMYDADRTQSLDMQDTATGT